MNCANVYQNIYYVCYLNTFLSGARHIFLGKFRLTMGKVRSHLFEYLKLGPYIAGSREIVYQRPENLETRPVRHFPGVV